MEIILGDRRTGKTTELIRRAAATPNAVILCAHQQHEQSVRARAAEMGVRVETAIPEGITCPNLIGCKIFVDECGLLLRRLLRGADVAATTSDTSDHPPMFLDETTRGQTRTKSDEAFLLQEQIARFEKKTAELKERLDKIKFCELREIPVGGEFILDGRKYIKVAPTRNLWLGCGELAAAFMYDTEKHVVGYRADLLTVVERVLK